VKHLRRQKILTLALASLVIVGATTGIAIAWINHNHQTVHYRGRLSGGP